MQRPEWKSALAFRRSIVLGISGIMLSEMAIAQIIPDNTLGTESSIVTPLDSQGLPVDQIDGGAIRGINLFHSFQEFNIDVGRGAYFFSPAGSEIVPKSLLVSIPSLGARSR